MKEDEFGFGPGRDSEDGSRGHATLILSRNRRWIDSQPREIRLDFGSGFDLVRILPDFEASLSESSYAS